ncbi:sporulation histidine kinase inhibitor Sda [Natribacillus halophilus]|nr:sporulation histidine kinase inhibitor Sda [Natribacillus halophilus]
MSDKSLVEAYVEAKKLDLEKDFVQILETEIDKRKLSRMIDRSKQE